MHVKEPKFLHEFESFQKASKKKENFNPIRRNNSLYILEKR